ncbi:MAG TPA: pitrilysin family protein, partial [Bacteroidales bacterium]|nr:pitrilysin family protein [Bacteroidales bacterium]
ISFLPRYYKRAAELLADVLFNSIFPYKEIEKEKDVIIDEIHSYKDDPQELIYDEFEELLFAGHSLSHSILGEPEIIKSFSKNKIINFIKRNYVNQNIVICSVGKIKFNNLVHILQKYFLQSLTDKESNKREFFQNKNSKFIVEKIKNVNHSHCIIGSIAYNNKDKKRIPFTLVDNFLGGPTMTSRLSLQIREKYGYSYNIYSSYIPFCDTGVFNIYFSCENENVNKIIELIRKELNKLCEIKLGPIQLLRAKNQLMGQIAISLESNLNEMLSIGKSLIVFDKVDPIDKIFQKIENITASDILEVSNEILRFDNLSILIYKAN